MIDIDLRPYQRTSIEEMRQGIRDSMKRQILYLPTGGGKTLTALYLIQSAMDKGTRVVFICNRRHLVAQASKVFTAYGVDHGILQGENTHGLGKQLLIASIDTIRTRGFPEDIRLMVFDEAHFVAGNKAALELIKRHNNITIVGLSATPFAKGLGRMYSEMNGPLFHRIVAAVTIKDLIAQGYLTDCDIYAPSAPDMTGCKLVAGDYTDKDAEERSNTPTLVGDILEHWVKLSYGKPTVVFASSVAHSKHICGVFQSAGISAEHIDAYTTDEDRHEIFARFDSGETLILSNVGVLCEGWDAPHCHTMILARPTRSLARYIQMAGRVLRPHETKQREDGSGAFALILDHSGTVANLGFPTDDLPLTLDDGKPKKSAGSDKKEREKLPKECPECHYLKPPGERTCAKCGHTPQYTKDVETAQGELTLIKGGKRSSKMDKQQTYSGLLHYQMMKGYRHGWAAHKYRTIFDVWPRGLDEKPAPPTDQLFSWIKSENIRHSHRKNKDASRKP